MRWFKWYPRQWIGGTIRDQLSPAQRATFHDFVCLAALNDEAPGTFKVASWKALSRILRTPLKTVDETVTRCLHDRLEVTQNSAQEIIVSISNWGKYQAGPASKTEEKDTKMLANFHPRLDKSTLDKIIVEPPLSPPGAPTTTTTRDDDKVTRDTGFGTVCRAYEAEIGMLTSHIGEELKFLYADSPDGMPAEAWAGWIVKCINYAGRQNKRNLAYVLQTLKGWQAQGWQMKSKQRGGTSGQNQPEPDTETSLSRALRAAAHYQRR